MTGLFFTFFNSSIAAAILILAVILFRRLLRRAPRGLLSLLWILVALRLMLPFSVRSAVSLIPAAVSRASVTAWTDVYLQPSGQPTLTWSPPEQLPQTKHGEPDGTETETYSAERRETDAPDQTAAASPGSAAATSRNSRPHVSAAAVLSWIWAAGAAGMLIYAAVRLALIYRRMRTSTQLSGNVWVCDREDAPFILGIFRPRICLPASLEPVYRAQVLAHENAHLRRRDHLWKLLAYLLLSIYWYHPLVWVAYVLFSHDIEQACDERVVRDLAMEGKQAYAQALLDCSVVRRPLSPVYPLAFGGSRVKERVRAVLLYHKPTCRIVMLVCAALLVTAVCFLTDPLTTKAAQIFTAPADSLTLDELEPTDTLVLYVPKVQEAAERRLADLYRLQYGVKVELVVIESGYDYAAYTQRVMEDLAAGSGPDVLFLHYLDLDVAKAAMKGELLDLTDILAGDKTYSEEEYLSGAFEAGRVGGRQYMIPLSVGSNQFLSIPSKLEELGFRWDGIHTMSDFLEEIARVTPNAEEDADFRQMMASKNMFLTFLELSDIRLLDYETGTVLPDERALGEFLRAYKAYFPYDVDGIRTSKLQFGGVPEILILGASHFLDPSDVMSLVKAIRILQEKAYDCEVAFLPGQTGEVTGSVLQAMAINAGSENKRNAYNYIRLMLSEALQTDWRVLDGLPVRKEAICVKMYDGIYMHRPQDRELAGNRSAALRQEGLYGLYERFTEVEQYAGPEPDRVRRMVYASMLPFFRDEKSYAECLKELKSSLTDYLNE